MGRPVVTCLPTFGAAPWAWAPHRPPMSTVLLLLPMVQLGATAPLGAMALPAWATVSLVRQYGAGAPRMGARDPR